MSQWMANLRAFLRKCFLENMQLSPSLTRKPGTLQLAVSSHDIQLQFQNCNIKRLPLQKQSCDQYQHSYVVLGAWVVAKDASKRRRINPRFVKIPLAPFVDKEPSRREIGRGEGLEGQDGHQQGDCRVGWNCWVITKWIAHSTLFIAVQPFLFRSPRLLARLLTEIKTGMATRRLRGPRRQ